MPRSSDCIWCATSTIGATMTNGIFDLTFRTTNPQLMRPSP
jgi:hypothetical protein